MKNTQDQNQRPEAVVSCGGSPTIAKLKSQYMASRDKFLSSEDASERPKLFLDLCNIMLAIVDASLFGERSENIQSAGDRRQQPTD